jgi:hypothetical protein
VERKVATDCFVDVDTVRYSLPDASVRQVVQVLIGDDEVRVFAGNAAHFPGIETLEEFEFKFQPSVDHKLVRVGDWPLRGRGPKMSYSSAYQESGKHTWR